MEKKVLPITLFERLKEPIEVLVPGFFQATTPDIALFHQMVDTLKDRKRKKDPQKIKRVLTLIEFLAANARHLRDKYGEARDLYQGLLESTQENIKKLEEGKGDEETKKIVLQVGRDYDYEYVKSQAEKETLLPLAVYDTGIKIDMERFLWVLHRFNRANHKVFRVEEQLTHELFLTDVSKVDSSFLQLPYPCFCITFPFTTQLTIRKKVIQSVYVSERMHLSSGNQENYRVLELLYLCEGDLLDHQLFEVREGNLLKQIQGTIEEWYPGNELAQQETRVNISFLLGVLLYMNSREVVYKDLFPLVFAKKKDSKFPVCALGFGIPLNKELHRSTANSAADIKREIQVLKWTVRGHFRHYTPENNTRWKEKKTTWIRPYLKGREKNTGIPVKPNFYEIK